MAPIWLLAGQKPLVLMPQLQVLHGILLRLFRQLASAQKLQKSIFTPLLNKIGSSALQLTSLQERHCVLNLPLQTGMQWKLIPWDLMILWLSAFPQIVDKAGKC